MTTTISSPTADEIKAARKALSLTQEQAAILVKSTRRTWQDWEAGKATMHPGLWLLFHLKTDAFGIWKNRQVDGLDYQKEAHSDW